MIRRTVRRGHFEVFFGSLGVGEELEAVIVEEEETARLEPIEVWKHDRRVGGSERTMRESESGRGARRPCALAALARMSKIAFSGCVAELPIRIVRMVLPLDAAGAKPRMIPDRIAKGPASCLKGRGEIFEAIIFSLT